MTKLNAGDDAPHFKLSDGEGKVWDLVRSQGPRR